MLIPVNIGDELLVIVYDTIFFIFGKAVISQKETRNTHWMYFQFVNIQISTTFLVLYDTLRDLLALE